MMEPSGFHEAEPARADIRTGAGADRRTRASLRRLAAGEQRKRSLRLTEALRDDAFCLRYMPRHRLGDGADRIAGAELWLGLPNRRRGLIAVAPLLRDLDNADLREELLRFTLDAAAAEVAIWPAHWRVAVPVPSRTLADGVVCTMLVAALTRAGLSDDRIDLQIDESELVEGGASLHRALAALRERGIGVILEGFGGMFGSLALLPRLPLTGLKLDRRLAHTGRPDQGIDETILIRASVATAHLLGWTVTIDGVETDAELERVRGFGVDLVQGPWIGPALPAEAFRARARSGG